MSVLGPTGRRAWLALLPVIACRPPSNPANPTRFGLRVWGMEEDMETSTFMGVMLRLL